MDILLAAMLCFFLVGVAISIIPYFCGLFYEIALWVVDYIKYK